MPGARNLGDVNSVNIVEAIRDAANVMTKARKLLTIVIRVYRALRGLATGTDFLGRGVELGRGFSGAGGTGSTAGAGGAGCTGSAGGASASSGSSIGARLASGAAGSGVG